MSEREIKTLFQVNNVTTYFLVSFNSLTLLSDQDRISPYNINTISSRQVMRIKKTLSARGSWVDPIPNSPN